MQMTTSAVVKVETVVNDILNSILVNLRLFSSCSTLCFFNIENWKDKANLIRKQGKA